MTSLLQLEPPAMTDASKPVRSSPMRAAIIFIVLMVGVLIGIRLWGLRSAPMPAEFEGTPTLAAAIDQSGASGKPVLVLASADWCGYCQRLKRGALTDPEVVGYIKSNTIPVYLDVTDGVQPEAADLNINALPAMIAIKGGRPIGRIEGAQPASAILAWLKSL